MMGIEQKYFLRRLMRDLKWSSMFGDYMYRKLLQHPQGNSLSAYHFILSWMGIENYGVNISLKTLVTEMPLPAIAHLNRNKGEFVIVEKFDNNEVGFNNGVKSEKMALAEFDHLFTGNAIIIAAGDIIIDKKDYFQWLVSYVSGYLLPVMFAFIIILCLFSSEQVNRYEITFIVLFASGLIASSMLSLKHLGVQSKLTDTICTKMTHSADCNAVIGSKGGKLLGLISWSDIGVIFFTTALSSLLLFGLDKMSLILFAVSILASPYVLYSIWYQWKEVGAWCPLCLVTQLVLIGQLMAAMSLIIHHPVIFYLFPTIVFLIVGITVAAIVFALNPILARAIRLPYTESSYLHFRLSYQIRNVCITDFRYNTLSVNQIIYNPDAETIVTFVFSPYCGPCISKINGLLSLLKKYEIGLRIVFAIKDIEDQKDRHIVEYFISEFYKSPDSLLKILTEYSENYSVIRQKQKSFKTDLAVVQETINIHSQWIDQSKFIGTPVILLNNVHIPANYQVDDLEIMIVEQLLQDK